MKQWFFLGLLDLYKVLMRYKLETLVPTPITSRIIKSRFNDKIYEIDGHRMYLNEGLFSLSLGLPYEPLETRIAKKFVKKGNTVLDLGANVGYYTLLFAKQVGELGRVVAFEPSPVNCKILKRNIIINGYKNVDIQQAAVSDKSGRTRLYLSAHPGAHRIYSDSLDDKRKVPSNSSIDIEIVSLDDYFRESVGKIDFVKMDIQGAEYLAIMGMKSILTKSKTIKIMTEFSPKLLKAFGTDAYDYLHELQHYGFFLYNINNKTNRIELSTADDLSRRYNPKNDLQTNLIFTRQHIDDPNLESNSTTQKC